MPHPDALIHLLVSNSTRRSSCLEAAIDTIGYLYRLGKYLYFTYHALYPPPQLFFPT